MSAFDRFKFIHRQARLSVRHQLSNAGRFNLWGLMVKPAAYRLMKLSIVHGFNETDSYKLVTLLRETLAKRA